MRRRFVSIQEITRVLLRDCLFATVLGATAGVWSLGAWGTRVLALAKGFNFQEGSGSLDFKFGFERTGLQQRQNPQLKPKLNSKPKITKPTLMP